MDNLAREGSGATTTPKSTTSIVKGAIDVEGRSDDNVAQLLSRYKLANGKRNDACSRTAQLFFLEVLIVLGVLLVTIFAGALHRPSSKSGHSSSRYQRGRESSIRAFRLADKDGDGKLTPDEVRTLFEDDRHNSTAHADEVAT